MNRLSIAATTIAVLAVCALLALSVMRVGALMDRELDRAGATTTLAAGEAVTLLEVDLLAGDFLTFEICSSDPMEPARWAGAATLGVQAGATEPRDRVLAEPVTAPMLENARRNSAGACLDFAHAGPLETSGHYVVEVHDVTAAIAGTNVRARVLAERPLTASDRNSVLAILLGAIACVVALALRTPAVVATEGKAWSVVGAGALAGAVLLVGVGLVGLDPRLSAAVKAILALSIVGLCAGSFVGLRKGVAGAGAFLGVLAVIELSTLLSVVTPPGPAFGLLAGLALAFAEIAIAVGLAQTFAARSETVGALGLQRPQRMLVAGLGFALAPIVGVFLRVAATQVLAAVPSTGEAPIEAYVSWPSGLLSFAALSAIAPIGEEIFFRGLVYGSLRGKGGAPREALAFVGAWLLFVVAHVPQTWGSWGGLAAIAVAGLGFTTLRAATGSVLVAATAHLVYNGLLAALALAAN